MSKYDYARTLAASLALILIRQRDAVGLSVFDETMNCFITPHSTNIQLKIIMAQLDRLEASGSTRCGAALSRLARTLKKRGLCIVISDLFDEPEEIIRGLRHLRFKKQDVIVLRIADPMEQDFKHAASLKIHDLETGEKLSLDPVTAARFFNQGVAGHHAAIKKACRELAIDCELIQTNEPFHKALLRVLDKRRRML
jgi:Uncharacterized conserved protein (some members contain a von Willebrand factor type A (vWA) domain)